MIGASEGFDVSSPDWDVKITLYGLVSRLFIKGLRQKVKRGMLGAARRGGCLGKLPLGFTRRPILDENGIPVCRPDGQPNYEPCADPNSSAAALLLFELFTQKNWSAHKITKCFNEQKIEKWDGWTEKAIKKNLWNPAYIGVFIWNRTRREYDWETEKMVVLKNPRSVWEVKYNPDLAIIPQEWWRKFRKRLAEM